MKVIYPNKIELKVEEIGDSRWKLDYLERLPEGNQEAVKTTKKLLTQLSKTFTDNRLKVRTLKNAMSLSLVGTREEVYDAVVGEFLPLSTLGKKTIGELFTFFGALAGLIPPPEEAPTNIAQPSIQPGITGEIHGSSRGRRSL